MADKPLDQEPELTETEEETAFMGFVSQGGLAGRVRKLLVAKLAGVLHRQNPMITVWTKEDLLEDISTSAPRDTDFSEVYNLDFKSGSSGDRYNFTDDYTFFELFLMDYYSFSGVAGAQINPITPASYGLIPSSKLANSSQSDPVFIPITNFVNFAIYKESDTSFRIAEGAADEEISNYDSIQGIYLCRIVGWKMTVRPTTL